MPVEYVEPGKDGRYEAGAYRLSEIVQNVLSENGPDVIGWWIAFHMGDPHEAITGTYRAGPAATKAELVEFIGRGQDETRFGYLAIPPQSLSPRSAANYLKFVRQQHNNGWRIRSSDRNPNIEAVPVERPGALDLWRPDDFAEVNRVLRGAKI